MFIIPNHKCLHEVLLVLLKLNLLPTQMQQLVGDKLTFTADEALNVIVSARQLVEEFGQSKENRERDKMYQSILQMFNQN